MSSPSSAAPRTGPLLRLLLLAGAALGLWLLGALLSSPSASAVTPERAHGSTHGSTHGSGAHPSARSLPARVKLPLPAPHAPSDGARHDRPTASAASHGGAAHHGAAHPARPSSTPVAELGHGVGELTHAVGSADVAGAGRALGHTVRGTVHATVHATGDVARHTVRTVRHTAHAVRESATATTTTVRTSVRVLLHEASRTPVVGGLLPVVGGAVGAPAGTHPAAPIVTAVPADPATSDSATTGPATVVSGDAVPAGSTSSALALVAAGTGSLPAAPREALNRPAVRAEATGVVPTTPTTPVTPAPDGGVAPPSSARTAGYDLPGLTAPAAGVTAAPAAAVRSTDRDDAVLAGPVRRPGFSPD
ncbi:hypothetical protein SAMN05443575_4139 [Jatrophihabitans endophyticus]|uniref:Uncharacterized protein n=1 Tax=Jatrophihabitans endophyticus TaxID=1206085 RepID=A0A1M5U5E6_9ACTN|nr:hypothetical protein [Jatrophihabitans endophyticus]SHH58179.1 hypothetical protein SAMN05443575_4139 [Jatrophihabitans endophyticus]